MRVRMVTIAAAVTASITLMSSGALSAPVALNGPAPVNQLASAVRLHPPAPPAAPSPAPSLAQEVFFLVNAHRAAVGLAPMTYDSRLEQAAQAHSADMAARMTMSHTGGDGSTFTQRIDRTGFSWRSAAENVAKGYSTAAAVMTGWMNSSGHRANILSANTHIGVGVAQGADGRLYWTQVFATPR